MKLGWQQYDGEFNFSGPFYYNDYGWLVSNLPFTIKDITFINSIDGVDCCIYDINISRYNILVKFTNNIFFDTNETKLSLINKYREFKNNNNNKSNSVVYDKNSAMLIINGANHGQGM